MCKTVNNENMIRNYKLNFAGANVDSANSTEAINQIWTHKLPMCLPN